MKLNVPTRFVELFWGRVNKAGSTPRPDLGPCWEWEMGFARTGYGQVQCRAISQAPMLCHRVSWMLTHGLRMPTLHVLHRCDNPKCVRPTHLFLGTQRDNVRDRTNKGRTASGDKNGARTHPERNNFIRDGGSGKRGQSHPMAKLTAADVFKIRSMGEAGVSSENISKEMCVGYMTIYRILKRKSWRCLQPRLRLKGN